MKQEKNELRARLVAEFERRLDEALKELGDLGTVRLEDVEALGVKVGARTAQGVSQGVVEVGSGQTAEGEACPKCGGGIHYVKGLKRRYLRMRSGEVSIERAYYYCSQCGCGHFPPG